MDWRWAAACVQGAGRGHIVSPRSQLVVVMLYFNYLILQLRETAVTSVTRPTE